MESLQAPALTLQVAEAPKTHAGQLQLRPSGQVRTKPLLYGVRVQDLGAAAAPRRSTQACTEANALRAWCASASMGCSAASSESSATCEAAATAPASPALAAANAASSAPVRDITESDPSVPTQKSHVPGVKFDGTSLGGGVPLDQGCSHRLSAE